MLIQLPIKNDLSWPNYLEAIKQENGKYEIKQDGIVYAKDVLLQSLSRAFYKVQMLEQKETRVTIRVITYTPIHSHSGYSLLDGAMKIKDMVDKIEYCGALTDHGVMYGFLDFYKRMKGQSKKPIIGFEAYTTDFDRNKNQYHMVLLAKNEIGFRNLIKLSSEAYDHFYRKPHVDLSVLKGCSEGIIATSACLGGLIPKLLLKNKIKEAEEVVDRFIDIFADDFYIEIQRHGIDDEKRIEPLLIQLAKKKKVKIVAGIDAHYTDKKDDFSQEVLLCLQTGKTIHEPHMVFEGTGYHMMSSEEVESLFSDLPEALDATLEIADKINLELSLGEMKMPEFDIPADFKSRGDYFDYLCKKGYDERFENSPKHQDPEYLKRLHYEMDMIKQMGFVEYFLIVWDFIDYAKRNGILVGPGRGSAVGSLVSYCLHITDIDPLPYGLLFERFLNPERISWPDIDTDFDDTRRDEVIEYLMHKYGSDKVCKIITFGSLNARSVVRDVSRVMGHGASFGDQIAKMIPTDLKMTLEKALNVNPELKQLYESDERVEKVIETAKRLEGLPRHASQHACGLVISKDSIYKNLPTVMAKNEETGEKETTSQVNMTEVEELGLLKMDLLGLKTLGVIGNAFKLIKERHGIDLRMDQIPLGDKNVYRFLKEGHTSGVFQLESPGMTALIKEMYSDIDSVPDAQTHQLFERLIAAVSLYRPGPMDYIPTYIRNMNQPNAINYEHPLLEPILSTTYGVIVYQEQVMQIVQSLAGYTLGRADIVRKAMGKKKIDIMEKEEKVFVKGNLKDKKDPVKVNGCLSNGVSEAIALSIWDKMKRFAEYAFNKSHATAYAYLACVTAWLSCYYEKEFSAALLNSALGNYDKLKGYLSQVNKRGINLLPPDVNLSGTQFVVEGSGIRFGLMGLKNMGKSSNDIISIRNNRPFTNLEDLVERLGSKGCLNKKVFEALVYSGALDTFEGTRKEKIDATELVLKHTNHYKKNSDSLQVNLFDIANIQVESSLKLKKAGEIPTLTKLNKEKEIAGFYLSGHPIDKYVPVINKNKDIQSIGELIADPLNYVKKDVRVIGIIVEVKMFFTKKGDPMCKLTIEDRFATISCVVFPRYLDGIRHLLHENNLVVISGRFESSSDWGDQIICDDAYHADDLLNEDIPKAILIGIQSKKEQEQLLKIIDDYKGIDTRVVMLAKNKQYPVSTGIAYTPETISALKENFSHVQALF